MEIHSANIVEFRFPSPTITRSPVTRNRSMRSNRDSDARYSYVHTHIRLAFAPRYFTARGISLPYHCCSFALRTFTSRVRARCELLRASDALRLDSTISAPCRPSAYGPSARGGGGGRRRRRRSGECMRGGDASSFLSSLWRYSPLPLVSSRLDFASRTSRTSSTSIAIIVAIRPGRAGDDFFHSAGMHRCTAAHGSGFSPGK